MAETWMKCTECRTDIAYGATYQQCSVSTCNRSRMPLFFCSVACWDSHLSTVRHRDAYAVEVKAPTREAWAREQAAHPPEAPRAAPHTPDRPAPSAAPNASMTAPASAPVRRVVGDASPSTAAAVEGNVTLSDVVDKDILIVVSKMKKYIKDRSGFNTSDAVADQLSEHVRAICDEAIRAAARDERKTVLDRDVPRIRR
ncbi:MAG: hypothetical protein SFX73_28315 [Kofleriaceae bacterium]|nr:hypothetical protein [Kofleriaceae bacterium]